jgi:hypothetical protein
VPLGHPPSVAELEQLPAGLRPAPHGRARLPSQEQNGAGPTGAANPS